MSVPQNVPQRELITFYGQTTSGTLSGVITLNSDMLYATTSGIQPAKGTKLKIWEFRVTGMAATVVVTFQKTSGGTTVVHNALTHAQTSGNSVPALIIPLIRPIVIPSIAGTEFIQVGWNQGALLSNFGPTNVEFDAEFEAGSI